jgi:hypothetical protein
MLDVPPALADGFGTSPRAASSMKPLWKFLTSLRLTVWTLVFAVVLVFLGTLAQVQEGLWNAQDRWFRSFFVQHEPPDPWWVPPIFPGGYLIGIVLLVNLVAAHLSRFQWSAKKIGIHLTHLGVITLLVGQLLTDMLSVESHMRFREGETRSYSEGPRGDELVFLTDATAENDEVIAIPEEIVAERKDITHPKLPFTVKIKDYSVNGEVISHSSVVETAGKLTAALATVDSQFTGTDGLVALAESAAQMEGRAQVWREAFAAIGEGEQPDIVAAAQKLVAQPERAQKLAVELRTRFRKEMTARFIQQGGAMRYAAEKLAAGETIEADKLPGATATGAGQRFLKIPLAEAKDMDTRNMPFAVIELIEGGKKLGEWLVSPYLNDQTFTAGGKAWRTAFRWTRSYHPFSVTLLKTTHEIYPGTITRNNPQGIPKNFQSRVRVTNAERSENREVDIYMNNPLRYGGLTFFQYQMGRDEIANNVGTSTLQVVRNPSWITPYLGCIIVGVGMTWQFMAHLLGFIAKRKAPAPAAPRKKGAGKGDKALAKATT